MTQQNKTGKFSNWLRMKYIDWQKELGDLKTVSQFAQYLDLAQPTLTSYMNGSRKPSFKTTMKIVEKLDDYEALDILDFANPKHNLSLGKLPPEVAARIKLLVCGIEMEMGKHGVDKNDVSADGIAMRYIRRSQFVPENDNSERK